eukprot:g12572.t1
MAGLRQLVTQYQRESTEDFKDADEWFREDPKKRNELARGAARDHRDRFEVLSSSVRQGAGLYDLEEQLRTNRTHAEYWESEFTKWAGKQRKFSHRYHVHEYARKVHGWNKDRYNSLLQELDGLPSVSVSGTTTRFLCLFSGAGGANGRASENVRYETGMKTDNRYSAREYGEISARVDVDVRDFITHVQAETGGTYGGEIQSGNWTFATTTSTETRSFEVHFDRPCYLYQVVTELTLDDQSRGQFRGGLIQLNTPFPPNVSGMNWPEEAEGASSD